MSTITERTHLPLTQESVLTILAQIGTMNVMAISGGRTEFNLRDDDGIPLALDLPVSSGYKVRIALAGNDTYTIHRILVRGSKTFLKGALEGIYFDQLGELAYVASCYKNREFGEAA